MVDRRPGDARRAALRFLLDRGAAHDPDARRHAAARLPVPERGLFVELVAGVTRARILYDAIIAAHSSAALGRIEPRLLGVLRLGLHQILRLERMPSHAAVASVLELLPGRKARGFANAILRAVLREGRFSSLDEARSAPPRRLLPLAPERYFLCSRDVLPDPERAPLEHLAIGQAFDPEAAGILVEELGRERASALMVHANLRPCVTLRRHHARSELGPFRARLESEGLEIEEEAVEGLIQLRRGDPAGIAAFRDGLFSIQGSFASRVAPLLAPRPTEAILDLCAPPGGKTLQLAELAPEARIVAFAQDSSGRRRLQANIDRCGPENIEVVVGDDPFSRGPFDAVLLDVPCSNTGVLGRRPEARERLTEKDLGSLESLQRGLLDRGLEEISGRRARLVYATCSVLPRENERLVRALLQNRAGLRLEAEISVQPDAKGRDGGYAALIVSG